jgi:hypothetical protein
MGPILHAMKQSINLGSIKNLSMTPLRVLSGAPKCQTIGATEIIYNGFIGYFNGGIVGIQIPGPGLGQQVAITGLPFGKWVLDTTLTITKPVSSLGINGASSAFSFSIMQSIAGFTHITDSGPIVPFDQALIQLGAWRQAILSFRDADRSRPANAGDAWLVGGPSLDAAPFQREAVGGPDLLSILDFDVGVAQTKSSRVVLPEQSDFCSYSFYPYLRYSGFFGNVWVSSSGSNANVAGWSLPGFQDGVYPNGTQIGTVQFRFRRSVILPIFTFSVDAHRNTTFTNKTIYNHAFAPIWDWDFGDGSHSSAMNPVHTFASTGKYDVTLKVTDGDGVTYVFDQVVNIPLVANFTYILFNFISNAEILPTSTSLGATTWDWDWGDGSTHAFTETVPAGHDYPKHKTFTITLTVSDGAGHTAAISKTFST